MAKDRSRNNVVVYDELNKRWVSKYADNTSKNSSEKNAVKKSTTSKTPSNSNGNKGVGGNSDDPKSAKGKAINKKKKSEYYTLSGSLSILPTPRNIKIRPSNTVSLQGLGKWLTGKYYVASVTRSLSNSGGYSETIEVFRPNFREHIKKTTSTKKKAKSNVAVVSEVANNSRNSALRSVSRASNVTLVSTVKETVVEGNLRTYTINSTGDTLWNIAKRFYGDSAKWDRLYVLNTGETPDPLNLVMGTKIVIP